MKIRVLNRTKGSVIATEADVADSSKSRRDGLLKRRGLAPGEGLWIVPCEAVHCFFMKFTIDILFLSKSRQVLKAKPSVRPWRIAACLRAHSVLELPEGRIASTGTSAGDQLEFEKLLP